MYVGIHAIFVFGSSRDIERYVRVYLVCSCYENGEPALNLSCTFSHIERYVKEYALATKMES